MSYLFKFYGTQGQVPHPSLPPRYAPYRELNEAESWRKSIHTNFGYAEMVRIAQMGNSSNAY